MFYETATNRHGMAYDPFKALIAPRPVGWISTLSADGRANLAPYSFFNAFAESPHYIAFGSGVSRHGGAKDTLRNIEATGEFVHNLATFALRDAMNASSANVVHGMDEFEIAGLARAPCRLVSPPRVAASPVAMECKLHQIVALPGDDGTVEDHLVIGRVVGIHIDEAYIINGRVDTAAMQPIARLGYSEYATVTEAWRMRRPD
jgi:flavin reductase (DIM6/NTAB) family NADH-FMN oxidoreductase RutF